VDNLDQVRSQLAAQVGDAAAKQALLMTLQENMLLDSILGSPTEMHAHLSSRELEIFRLLVRGKNLNEIAYQLTISNKTVSSHKKRLMEKMHFSSMADLMRYAVQRRLFDEQDMSTTQNSLGMHFTNISPKSGIPSDDLTYQLLN
jgi:DNA-binding NarL/FixJ family response regulator